jgi:opacity protein-like surface antigen
MVLAPVPTQSDLFEVSLGYNYIYLIDQYPETRNLHGVDVAAFVNATSWLAMGGEFMADFGSHTLHNFSFGDIDVDSRRYVYLFGPRITMWHNPQFRVFTEALAGGVHAEAELSSQSRYVTTQKASADAFAMAVGGGFDWRLTNHLSWRILQADYLGTDLGKQWQNNFRASTAIAYSFGQR